MPARAGDLPDSRLQGMTQELLVEQRGPVCALTLNRPEKRNALSPSLLLELTSVLQSLPDETRVVVIQGAGEKAFSAGYDLTQAPPVDPRASGGGSADPQRILNEALDTIRTCRCPVIAMVRGICMGAGLELAATCDIRIAAEDARFAMPPAKLGTLYHTAGIWKFVSLMGPAAAKELFFAGTLISAARALQHGLVNQVVPTESLAQAGETLTQDIVSSAPLSVAAVKEVINRLAPMPALSPEEERHFRDLMDKVRGSEDYQEGRRAFAEKRKPVFRGR